MTIFSRPVVDFLDPQDLPDVPEMLVSPDSLEPLELPVLFVKSLVLLDPLAHPDPTDLLDLSDLLETPEDLETMEPQDLKEIVDKMDSPVNLAPLENMVPMEMLETKVKLNQGDGELNGKQMFLHLD